MISKMWHLSVKNLMKSERGKGQMVSNLADMRNVRPCHSSLSLQINGRKMTRLGAIPETYKAMQEWTFREEYLCYSFMLILCGKQLHLYSEWRALP